MVHPSDEDLFGWEVFELLVRLSGIGLKTIKLWASLDIDRFVVELVNNVEEDRSDHSLVLV